MLISYNWLRELTGTKLNPQDVGDRLTSVGLAVDKVEARGDDQVLDVEVASNRPDCLSHVGVARELAVIQKSQVSSPKSQVPKTQAKLLIPVPSRSAIPICVRDTRPGSCAE